MPNCEHFVFTAAKIGINEGYQVVAKSDQIPKSIDKKLRDYLFPLGIDLNTFSKSKSLLLIDKNTIMYSIVKNIGIGYDGRKGTLYNHSFIINKDEFEKLGFDSRIFDKYFIENPNIRGVLKPIQFEKNDTTPDFKLLNHLEPKLLKSILHFLFKKSKLALMDIDTNNTELIQNLLSVLPVSIRLVSFSTAVHQPNIQYKYNLIQIPAKAKTKLDKQFVLLSTNLISENEVESNRDLDVLLDIIKRGDKKALTRFHSDCETVLSQMSKIGHASISQIFDETTFIKLAKANDFLTLENKVLQLCQSKEFNESQPDVVLQVIKKIRKLVKKSLKKKKTKVKEIPNKESLAVVTKSLLDVVNYLVMYRQDKMTKAMRNESLAEIDRLKEILTEYFPKKERYYEFDPFVYVRMWADVAVKYYSSIASLMFGWR